MNRIRERRRALGMTMKELGTQIGVSGGAISHYETGRREPDPEMLSKIASALNVSVDYLLCRDSLPTADPIPANIARYVCRAEAHDMLDQLSDENYQAMLIFLKILTENDLVVRTDAQTDDSITQKNSMDIPKSVMDLICQLDSSDLEKVSIYMRGLLDGDKYNPSSEPAYHPNQRK